MSAKGIALDSLGKYNVQIYKKAIDCFDQVIDICKNDQKLRTAYVLALHQKGYSLGNRREYEKALGCFNEAIHLLEDMQKKGENPDHTIYADVLRNRAYAQAMSKYDFEAPSDENFKKVTKDLECAEFMDRDFAYSWNTHGYINLIYKRESDAIRCFDQAVKIDPKLTTAWYHKGYALSISSLNEDNDAIRCFDQAIKIDPNSPFPWLYKGYTMLKSKALDNALESFNRALEVDPSFTEAWISKGTCLISLGKYQQAVDCFTRAVMNLEYTIESTPEVQDWYFYILTMKLAYIFERKAVALDSIAVALDSMEQFDAAKDQFDKAIDAYNKLKRFYGKCVNPEIALVLYEKGYSLGNSKKYEEAKDCFRKSISQFEEYFQERNEKGKDEYKTDYANILRNIGFVCSKSNNHEEARKYFEMATRADPNFALAWNSKGFHKIRLTEITSKGVDDLIREAISDFDKAINNFLEESDREKRKIDENIAYAYYNKGYAYHLLENHKDAIPCFESATKEKHKFAEAWDSRGRCTYLFYIENKSRSFTELNNIKKCFDEALSGTYSNEKNRAYTLYNKAIVLKEMGSYEQAIECFDEALGINGNFYESWYSKGIILNYLGRYKQAIECFDEAIKSYSKGIIPNYLGRCKQAIECFDEAIKSFTVARENADIGKNFFENLFDLYAARGQGKYNIGDHVGALKDFNVVGDENLSDCKKSQKYNNIGICYHQDEDYKKAQKKYEYAIEKDPYLVDAHYNLAVLHINNNKIKEAKKSLDKCLDIVETEREPKVDVKEAARKAKHKLEGSGKLDRSDWYSWWFNSGIRKAVLGIALILILIAIFSPIIMMQILVIDPTIGV